MRGNPEDQLCDQVRRRRQQGKTRQLVGIILALEPGFVAGLLSSPVMITVPRSTREYVSISRLAVFQSRECQKNA